MDHKYRSTAVENLVESLSFEVEAVPQDNVPQHKSTSHLSPVNVKVRVRKKDKSSIQKGTICIPKVARTDNHPERIRLASSDQTIMSFNVLMEDSDNRKIKKKNIFGGCLHGTTDDDDGPYLPKEEASGSKAGYKQKLALSKTAGNQLAPGDMRRKPKKFFGPCKPGGCLDPPFGEDKYQYLPPDTKKPSTDHDIDKKNSEGSPAEDKIFEDTPQHPAIENESDRKTPKPPTFDDKIDKKNTRSPSSDYTTENEKKPSPCPKKDNICPRYDYKIDPSTTPFPLNGFGSAARSSKEGTDILDENESSTKQRKRKGSSDSASTVKISKRISDISNSMQNVPKGKTKLRLEDKESNSIITYAGDEDDTDSERINKNRKSSINTNRTSFDLNAPYYLPPKRDSRDKDTNEKAEKLRRSFEPLGKAQDDFFSDEGDGKQKKMLRTGIELHDEDVVSNGEYDKSNRKMDETVTNTKYVKRPSLQKSQDKEIDKLNASVRFPSNNIEKDSNEGTVDFPHHYDNNTEAKTCNKDQVHTRGSISKNDDETIENYNSYDPFAVNNENEKNNENSNTKTNQYNYSNKANSSFSNIETGKNNRLDKHPKTGFTDISYNSQKDVDIKPTEYSVACSLQSEKYKDYFELDTTDKDDTRTKVNEISEYAESTTDSKSLHADKDAQRYSFEKLDSKDIVTLKSGSFYNEISDVESDYKVTDSRSSITNKKYDDNDNAKVYTTDKDLTSTTKTPITKVDINSKETLHDYDVTVSSSHRVVNISPESTDGDGFELSPVNSKNRDAGYQKYKEVLTKTDKGLDIDIGSQKYDEIPENISKCLITDYKTQEMQAKRGSTSNIDIRNQKYDEISAKSFSGVNEEIRAQKYDEMTRKTDNGSNIDTELRAYEQMTTKRGSGSNTDIRNKKYDIISAKRGSGSNIDIGAQKYNEMTTKTGNGSNIDTKLRAYEQMTTKRGSGLNTDIRNKKYDIVSAKRDSGSNIDIRSLKYDDMITKTGSSSNKDIINQKYDKMLVKRGSDSNIDINQIKTQIYDGLSVKAGTDSNIPIGSRNYNEISTKIATRNSNSNKLTRDISLDLAFQNYYDGSVRVLKTLETPLDSKLQGDPDTFVIQKRISLDGERAQISIDPDTNMTIQLNRQSVDTDQEKDRNIHRGILISDEQATHSHHHHTHPHVTFLSGNLHENLSYLYEQELVPLQTMIKNLKAEIDALAGQHKRRERATQQRLRPVAHCKGIVIKK